jgi:hypothetical protein
MVINMEAGKNGEANSRRLYRMEGYTGDFTEIS